MMLREKYKRRNLKCESTDARHWGGAIRSSGEVAVMVMERRDCIRLSKEKSNLKKGGDFERDKTIHHFETSGDASF